MTPHAQYFSGEMSTENTDLVRRVNEAFNRGDLDEMLQNFAGPDFEYVASGMIPGAAGVYRGVDEYRRVFLEGFFSEFDDLQSEVNEIVESENQILVSLTVRGRGKVSGAETRWSNFLVLTVRDGKIDHGRGFTSRDEAFEAVGLARPDRPRS